MTYGFLYSFVMVFLWAVNKKPLTNQITLPTIEYRRFNFFFILGNKWEVAIIIYFAGVYYVLVANVNFKKLI